MYVLSCQVNGCHLTVDAPAQIQPTRLCFPQVYDRLNMKKYNLHVKMISSLSFLNDSHLKGDIQICTQIGRRTHFKTTG